MDHKIQFAARDAMAAAWDAGRDAARSEQIAYAGGCDAH